MTFEALPTEIDEVVVIRPRVFGDERGYFFESYHEAKFAALGLRDRFVQDSHSRSAHRVVRGLHYQALRAPTAKLVRCSLGRIFDVVVDIRVRSPTFGRHVARELSADNFAQIFVPAGFAHGFQVLSDFAEVQYKSTVFYMPEAEGIIRWDDPDLAIRWPLGNPVLSDRDRAAPTLAQYLAQPAYVYDGVGAEERTR